MNKGRYRGHYYQQLNHQRIGMMAQGLPAVETAVCFKALLLAGQSRQQYDLADGSLSVTGAKMKSADFAQWIAGVTPQVSVPRAQKAIETLCSAGLLAVTKAGYIKVHGWAQDQGGAPTAAAERKRRSLAARRLANARDGLAGYAGTVFEADDLISAICTATKYSRKISVGILKELSDAGDVVPAEGGRLCVQACVSSKPAAPAALLPPRESEGPDGRESGCDMSQPDGVTYHNHYNHIHKRDSNESHDHDARADTRAYEESPEPPLRAGSGPADSMRMIGGGSSAAGAGVPPNRSFSSGGSRGIDVWSVADDCLPETACRIFHPEQRAKTRGILESKLLNLRRQFGPQQAGIIFREEVSGVQTDVMCPGARELRFPERELCARLNERMGKPRRKERMA